MSIPGPTVTAARIPTGWEWNDWRKALAAEGLVVGGSLGPLAGKVFRLGHMGTQADADRMAMALETMKKVLAR